MINLELLFPDQSARLIAPIFGSETDAFGWKVIFLLPKGVIAGFYTTVFWQIFGVKKNLHTGGRLSLVFLAFCRVLG